MPDSRNMKSASFAPAFGLMAHSDPRISSSLFSGIKGDISGSDPFATLLFLPRIEARLQHCLHPGLTQTLQKPDIALWNLF